MGNSWSAVGQGFLVASLVELQSEDDHGLVILKGRRGLVN